MSSMKLIGKLGARSRQYDLDNKFNSRNYSEDGLKINLKDKHSQQTVTFGIDAVIDVLFAQLSHPHQETPQNQAADFIKSAFLCYIDPELDLDFIIATIIATKNNQQPPSASMFASHGIKIPNFQFNAREKQIFVNQMSRGCESHAFVKLLRCAIMGYKALSTTPEELKKQQAKQNKFMKWITQYFTLIYVIKNGSLTTTMVDEINPLVFVDMIVELLYHYIDNNSLSSKSRDLLLIRGSVYALKTMIRFLKQLYGDSPDIFNRLEIVSILIKRICNQVQELPKNLAINISIKLLVQELPDYAVRQHADILQNTLFLILNQSSDSVSKSIEERVKPTLNQLFDSLGIYDITHKISQQIFLADPTQVFTMRTDNQLVNEEIKFFKETLDKILLNILSVQESTQKVAIHFFCEIARRNDLKVCDLLRNLPKQKFVRQNRPCEIKWSQYLFEQEIQQKVKEIFDMYKGGYGNIQQLISFFNLVQFYLHNEDNQIEEKMHVFLGIADCILLILEDECNKMEAVYEHRNPMNYNQTNQSVSVTRLARRYIKLERTYQNYNKEYDPYSHTLHPHQILNSHFFEVNQQAKEDQHKDEIEDMRKQQSYLELNIFESRDAGEAFSSGMIRQPEDSLHKSLTSSFEKHAEASRQFQQVRDQDKFRTHVQRRIDDFIGAMFVGQAAQQPNNAPRQNLQKVHDVSNIYMRNLYEMYPNVRVHCELICKSMELLCDIASHQVLSKKFADRQEEFFAYTDPQRQQQPNNEQFIQQNFENSCLKTSFDFYMVEIKAKIICIFFKYFQRDERSVQKMAKKCIKRLLKIQETPYEAFPNRILRECVRPILNSINTRQQIQQFWHLGRLIKVLYNYFNPQIGSAVMKNLEGLFKQIQEDYKIPLLERKKPIIGQDGQVIPQTQEQNDQNANNPDGQQNQNANRIVDKAQVDHELSQLVDQHNIKVQQISTAVGIINSLHLLPLIYQRSNEGITQKSIDDLGEAVNKSLYFQKFLVEEFKNRLDQNFEKVLNELQAGPQTQAVQIELKQKYTDQINPLTNRIGYLRSEILEGVERYYNVMVTIQPQQVLAIQDPNTNPQLQSVILEILNRRQNFFIRERISLQKIQYEYCRHRNQNPGITPSFLMLINQVYIYSKFYPQCLKYQNSTAILDILREKWLNKDSAPNFTYSQNRDMYMRIQKSLVIYCRTEGADVQILFDLLKDFFCSIPIDLKPLVTLCTHDIPKKEPDRRKIQILETTLQKIQTSSCNYESKYYMFEFAFMPIALQCANDKQKFRNIFTLNNNKLIIKFIETFFAKKRIDEHREGGQETLWIWKIIYQKMEQRLKISYQNFFTEIVKVLIIIMRHIDTFQQFLLCCNNEVNNIIKFFVWIIKYATDQHLKEYAFFGLACFGLRMLDIPIDPPAAGEEPHIPQYNLMTDEFLEILSRNVVEPLFELNLEQNFDKTFLQVGARLQHTTLSKLGASTKENTQAVQAMQATEKLHRVHFKVHNKVLVQNTFVNLLKIFEDPRVQRQDFSNVMVQQHSQPKYEINILRYFKTQFSLKTDLASRMSLCNLISNNQIVKDANSNDSLQRRIGKTIKHFFSETDWSQNELVRLQKCREILVLTETLINWTQHLKNNVDKEQLKMFYTMVTQHQFASQLRTFSNPFLQQMKDQAAGIQQENKNEFYEYTEHCFQIIRRICKLLSHQACNMQTFKPENQLEFYEENEKVKLALKTAFNLNIQSLSIQHGFSTESTKRMLTDFLQNTYIPVDEMKQIMQSDPNYFLMQKTVILERNYKLVNSVAYMQQQQAKQDPANLDPKNLPKKKKPLYDFSESGYQIQMVLYPIHVIMMAVRQSKCISDIPQDSQFDANDLKPFLRQAMWFDVRKSLDRDLKVLQAKINNEFYINQQKSCAQTYDQMRPAAQYNVQQYQQYIPPIASTALMKSIADQTLIEQNYVQACLPHFSIRVINKFEKLKEQGIITDEEFKEWIDPDLFKQISTAIQQVVSTFKHVVCSDKAVAKQMQARPEDEKPSESEQSNGKKFNTYDDFDFKDDLVDFQLKDIDNDLWMKETIMIAIKSIVRRIKCSMNQEDTLVALEQLKHIFKAFYFQQMKTCEFLLEQFYDVMKYIIEDQPSQRVKLISYEKTTLLYKLLQLTKPKDISNGKTDPNSILNRISNLCLDFLESQPNIMQSELLLKLYEKIFFLNQFCSHECGQRQFRIFEKFFGASLKAKINFFINKLTLESQETFRDYSQLKYLLEFTLFNFNEDIPLHMIKNSTNLCPLSNKQVRIEGLELLDQTKEGVELKKVLKPFAEKYQKYKGRKLSALMKPLTEIIRLNPGHAYQEKNIAEKIFSKVFWQYWQVLDRADQQYLSESFNKIFTNFIKFTSSLQQHQKEQFGRTLLEQVVLLKEPAVRIEPEVLQYLGKHFNLWHVSIPQLEDHTLLYSKNERYIHALQELYGGLMEEDYSIGLSRLMTTSPEMRTMYTMAQHHNWEQLNSQFGQYVNFFAEQEGLLKHLENCQSMPGKYSRQLAKNSLIDMINGNEPQPRQINQRTENTQYQNLFETNPEVERKLRNRQFPKPGGNRRISDVDLRSWETLYLKSLRILKQQDLFKDVAENMQRLELLIENHWAKKDMRRLLGPLQSVLSQTQKHTVPLSSITRVRYLMYQGYCLADMIHQQDSQRGMEQQTQVNEQGIKTKISENYSETVTLSVRQLGDNLPAYTERIQNEYYILFQQILESQEGISNMIMDFEQRKPAEQRNVMNIWRERLPHKSESIQTWQELLENRNYVFQILQKKLQKQQQRQAMAANMQTDGHDLNVQRQATQVQLTRLDELKVIDQVDSVWNWLKLAEISRKHHLPNLAAEYLDYVKQIFATGEAKGDILKLERFKYHYENFKLQMKFAKDPGTHHEILLKSSEFLQQNEYDQWMHAEILRLMGQHYLETGNLKKANDKLNFSIEKHKREAKTWLVYAKLNETVYNDQQQKDERTVQMALKGYFNAMTLSQHKARLIIPNVLKLLKLKSYHDMISKAKEQPKEQNPQQQVAKGKHEPFFIFVSQNLTLQMPIWLWIFWLPQIIQFLSLPQKDLLRELSIYICIKICKLYPQVTWYPLKAKTYFMQQQRSINQSQQQPPSNIWQDMLKRSQQHLNKKNQKLNQSINQMMIQLKNISQQTKDEKLIGILQNSFNFNTYLTNRMRIEREWRERIQQISRFLSEETPQSLQAVQEQWELHLNNEQTRVNCFFEQIKIIKNIKDYLLIQSNMREQDIYLQEISPYLATFPQRGIELPGQHILSEAEPRPEKVIMIEKMGHEIKRMGQKEKKIKFICTNGKNYHFSLGGVQVKDYKVFLSQERAAQLKVITNMMFKKHKESARRGVKFYVAPQVLCPGSKLVQDDLTFGDLQETHDYLLQEAGLDPDQALLLDIQHVLDIFKDEDKTEISQITELQIQQINKACYKQMRHEVKPSLLSSYFHRIFMNADTISLFKKQFTKYHAINSFFSYVFNQVNQQELSSLSFCKSTGRINFSQANLKHTLPQFGPSREQYIKYCQHSFEEIEADIFKIPQLPLQNTESQDKQMQVNPQLQKNEYYVPFRITPNIEEFIGKIGIHGLFAGVITSASLAVCSQKQKMQVLLELLLYEENQQQNEDMRRTQQAQQPAQNRQRPESQGLEEEAKKFADFCMFKIASLSQHERIIEQPPKSEESKCQPLKPEEEKEYHPKIGYDHKTGMYKLGSHKVPSSYLDLEMDRPNIPEEFNKKIFALIEMATDDSRRCQKSITWCPWF